MKMNINTPRYNDTKTKQNPTQHRQERWHSEVFQNLHLSQRHPPWKMQSRISLHSDLAEQITMKFVQSDEQFLK